MRSFECRCGGKLFFHSMSCFRCGAVTARCPHCHLVSSATGASNGMLTCDQCSQPNSLCRNRVDHAVCNAAVAQSSPEVGPGTTLCRYCSMNNVIPNLQVDGNLEKWRLLERAKHRVLYDVDRIGFPIITNPGAGNGPALSFEFPCGGERPVSTGHSSGRITIDLAEADSVHRESIRVEFGEPQRTLVGHFRHELGHYFWEVSVAPHHLDRYRSLFGDERSPSYADAQKSYYAHGAPRDWQANHVSEYATMHSWEDFAETFNAYLDMVAIISTSTFFHNIRVQVDLNNFDHLLEAYQEIGVVANELNRDMGLIDLVPEVFTPPVTEKLRFVHSLQLTQESFKAL